MKLAALILSMLAMMAAVCVAAFFHYFTVMPTVRGDEFLVMRAEQAAECKLAGGCAIFSERELMQALAQLLQQYRDRKGL